MRLVDLNPQWIKEGAGSERVIGIAFDCPHCIATGAEYIGHCAAKFAESDRLSGPVWRREGETFDTLTISPSINTHGHWHGWIRNGEVIDA